MRQSKWYFKLLLSVISGLLLAFAWYPHGFVFIIFVAFLPLLFLSDLSIKENKKNSFGRGILLFYPAFFTFNIITTYWIAYCTVPGAIAAVILNALLQTIVFALWHTCRKQIKNNFLQYLLLISFVSAFEYLHLNWELTWPWLNLGNVFAVTPLFIQWYSITGTIGGTIWILLSNILIYRLLKLRVLEDKKQTVVTFVEILCVLLLPMILSLVMYFNADKKIQRNDSLKVVAVQPNTDPWFEEYSLTNVEEIDRFLTVAQPFLNTTTNLIVTPESSVAHSIVIKELNDKQFDINDSRYSGFSILDSIIKLYPNLNFVLGLSTIEQPRQFYNTAGFYNTNGLQSWYHKSRLVPGVEKMPYPQVFGFLGDILIELGGANSSLSTDTEQRVFEFSADGRKYALGTAICYESVYGELVGNFVKKGANVLAVITNDSWWDDSQGHGQHFEMARLRAIETRRYVVRAANGGFSGFIDPLGNVITKTKYDERTAVAADVFPQDNLTFYVKHGDYLAKIAAIFSIIGIISAIFCFCINFFKRNKA